MAPGKTMRNAFVESFDGLLRAERLNEHLFVGLRHARHLVEGLARRLQPSRPHTSLGGPSPREHLNQSEKGQTRNRLPL